jgi:ABC-type transport system substrate-binding protein/signal transduction histidine kinase
MVASWGSLIISFEKMSDHPIRLAAFSVDPPALEGWSSLDPETFTVTSGIFDALIYIGAAGDVRPALATSWRSLDSLTWELELRRGVTFHDGTPCDSESVVASLRAHFEPTPTIIGSSLFAAFNRIEAIGPHLVRITTRVPDAIFIRRLFVSHVAPAHLLRTVGREGVAQNPIGTGPYRFLSWARGDVIRLERFEQHWAGRATVPRLDLMIRPRKEWLELLRSGAIDGAINIDTNDATLLRDVPGIHVEHAPATITHWFTLRNRGPLADVRVRRALNHAIHGGLLATVVEHGRGIPQRALATPDDAGFPSDLNGYGYDPERASRLLAEAGYSGGFSLRGLVSESSSGTYRMVREFLSRVGVNLESSIVPRAEWFQRLGPHAPSDFDFAVCSIDNPIHQPLFDHFSNLVSIGRSSLLRDEEYDRRYFSVASETDPAQLVRAQHELERYVFDQALLLHTAHQHVYYATRKGITIVLPRSGHFDAELYLSLRVDEATLAQTAGTLPHWPATTPDLARLVRGTSPHGIFYLEEEGFEDLNAARVWHNVLAGQERWRSESEPMLRELVSQVEARSSLASILRSTERIGIVGWSLSGRRLFVNSGFQRWFPSAETPEQLLGQAQWEELRRQLAAGAAFVGQVSVSPDVRAAEAPASLMLTLMTSVDEHGAPVGWSLVLADFSGEEERVRTGAIRTILDRVPYGLFLCDHDGRVLSGYSRSCDALFDRGGRDLAGERLTELLGMSDSAATMFSLYYQQVFDDIMPEEVNLHQLPSRIRRGGEQGDQHFRLEGAVVRNEAGAPDKVLFTLLDINALVHAEREAVRNHGLLTVLRHHAAFASFLRELDRQAERLLSEDASPYGEPWEPWARRELHTWKGNLGMFGLSDLSTLIHLVEDQEAIVPQDVRRVVAALDARLEEHRAIWHLSRKEGSLTTLLPLLSADTLVRRVEAATGLAEAREAVAAFRASLDVVFVGDLATPLVAAVRHQAERRHKTAELVIAGADTPVPRHALPLFQVLPHLLRNAVDHGIELDRGHKATCGIVTLRSEIRESTFHLVVADDGQGMDEERLVSAAIAAGHLDSHRAKTLSHQEKLALAFLPAVSTAARVTETSGRGVGMEAVVETVHRLGGTISVASRLHQGTTFSIEIPSG